MHSAILHLSNTLTTEDLDVSVPSKHVLIVFALGAALMLLSIVVANISKGDQQGKLDGAFLPMFLGGLLVVFLGLVLGCFAEFERADKRAVVIKDTFSSSVTLSDDDANCIDDLRGRYERRHHKTCKVYVERDANIVTFEFRLDGDRYLVTETSKKSVSAR